MNFKVNDILERVTENSTHPKYIKIIAESGYNLNMEFRYLVKYFGKYEFPSLFWIDSRAVKYYKKCENKIVRLLYE